MQELIGKRVYVLMVQTSQHMDGYIGYEATVSKIEGNLALLINVVDGYEKKGNRVINLQSAHFVRFDILD